MCIDGRQYRCQSGKQKLRVSDMEPEILYILYKL